MRQYTALRRGLVNVVPVSERAVTDGDRCVTDSSLEFEHEVRAWDQKINEAAQDGFTVTVTWIVVSIDV
ncbi:MAG: hypothetical protein ACREX8_07300, partial [Gammaproteobacteria bacterium]